MKRIVRLTERDLTRIVRRVISEQTQVPMGPGIQQATAAGGDSSVQFKAAYNVGGLLYYYCRSEDGKIAGRVYDYDDKDVTAQVKLGTADIKFLKYYCIKKV